MLKVDRLYRQVDGENNMTKKETTKKHALQKEINFQIGMKKVQTGTADYVAAIKKFLEKNEIHQLKKALLKADHAEAMKRIHSLKIKSLNLGLMNLYELFVEMESVLKLRDLETVEELVNEADESKNVILTAIA